MADENQDKTEQNTKEKEPAKAKSGLIQWIIMALIVVLCSASGLLLGRLPAGSPEGKTQETTGQEPADIFEMMKVQDPAGQTKDTWYYNLEPIVACLDEPKVTRYIRATLTLVISTEVNEKKCTEFLVEKNPYITNWLTIYLAKQSVDDIRGDRNLKRIQSELATLLNEQLFPNSKPLVQRVLIQEFAAQ